MTLKPLCCDKLLLSILLCMLTFSTSATAADAIYYKIQGTIADLNRESIRLDDGFMPFSSTVKVYDIKGLPINTYQLNKNDFVELTIQNFDNRIRVDSIRRIPVPRIQAE